MKVATLKPRVGMASVSQVASTSRRDIRRVYDSRLWRDHVRPLKLAHDPLCQRCAYLSRRTAAEHVDHRLPLAWGGAPHDWRNLVSLCRPCHSTKTQCERTGEPFPEVAPSAPEPYGFGG